MNGQSRDTVNIGQRSQNKDKQNKLHNIENKKCDQHGSNQTQGVKPDGRACCVAAVSYMKSAMLNILKKM